jgi:ketosteroid isomerase-like protein
MMQTPSPAEIVDAFFDAIAARDFPRVRSLLSDDGFSTHSPIAAFNNADAYVADISRVGPILEAVQRRKTFVDGNDVCAIVDYVTRMDRRQVSPVAHLMQVHQGKITFIETFFDAREYAAMFDID